MFLSCSFPFPHMQFIPKTQKNVNKQKHICSHLTNRQVLVSKPQFINSLLYIYTLCEWMLLFFLIFVMSFHNSLISVLSLFINFIDVLLWQQTTDAAAPCVLTGMSRGMMGLSMNKGMITVRFNKHVIMNVWLCFYPYTWELIFLWHEIFLT